MLTKAVLKIADIIIRMESRFPLEQLTKEEQRFEDTAQFKNFFYGEKKDPHIVIKIEIVDRLPQIRKTEPVFIARHFEDGSENWRLLKKGNTYIYKCPLKDKKPLILINETFDRVTAYLLPKKDKGRIWDPADIIGQFLQVLLINYFALNKKGVFTHAAGVKDLDGKALIFSGKSGCGKTTTARLWHKHSKVMVINDDRIIVCKVKGKFLAYGSPWIGEFSDDPLSRTESAPLEKLFFIYHSLKNTVRRISGKEAFNLLYPALFPTFWDRGCLENIVSFCEDLVKNIPCYSLGFVNDKRVINFVRKVK